MAVIENEVGCSCSFCTAAAMHILWVLCRISSRTHMMVLLPSAPLHVYSMAVREVSREADFCVPCLPPGCGILAVLAAQHWACLWGCAPGRLGCLWLPVWTPSRCAVRLSSAAQQTLV